MVGESSEARNQPRSRIQSQDQGRTGPGLTPENFRLPKIYFFDLDTLPEERRKQMKENPGDFFNYGTLWCMLGFTENTWRLYSQFVVDNEEVFKRICEDEIITPNNLTGEQRGIFHQNAELNFCLPMDMGGLGPVFNGDRYSRVHFWDKAGTPVLKMKQSYNECFMSLEKTAKAYDRNYPFPAPPETPPETFIPLYNHFPPMMMPQMFQPMMSMPPPAQRRNRSPSNSSRSRSRSRSRRRSKHRRHKKSRERHSDKRSNSRHRNRHKHRK